MLKDIVESNYDPAMFPYKKGNSIRIGKCAIRKKRKLGYLVYDLTDNRQIARTFSIAAAIAIAKSIHKSNDTRKILEFDKVMEKHYNDCLFYKNTIDNTKDDFRREIAYTRFEIAKSISKQAKQHLDNIIFF